MDFLAGFILGLIGSLHCVGMCGPLILSLPLQYNDKIYLLLQSLSYNMGRVLCYSLLGLLVGLLGWGLYLGGAQKILSVSMGVFIITYTILRYGNIAMLSNNAIRLKGYLSQQLNFESLIKITSKSGAFRIGFLNGLLPCGLVYLALASAFTFPSPEKASLYMAGFGMGTFPLMTLVMFGGHRIRKLIQPMKSLIPLFLILMGLYLIYRGVWFETVGNPMYLVIGSKEVLCH